MKLVAAIALCASSAGAIAANDVYKCVDAAGKVTYASAPCAADAAKVAIPLTPEEARQADRDARNKQLLIDARTNYEKESAKRDAERAARDAKIKASIAALREDNRREAEADPWGVAERTCATGIQEKLSHLEPVGTYSHIGKGYFKDQLKVRVAVRLTDSFRAAPVGVIECEVDIVTRSVSVEKVRM